MAGGQADQIIQKAVGQRSIRVTEGQEHLVDEDLFQLVEPVQTSQDLAAEG